MLFRNRLDTSKEGLPAPESSVFVQPDLLSLFAQKIEMDLLLREPTNICSGKLDAMSLHCFLSRHPCGTNPSFTGGDNDQVN